MMKKILLLLTIISHIALQSQWKKIENIDAKADITSKNSYNLNINELRSQLSQTQKTGRNAKGITITIPSADGKFERFSVFSFPVMDEKLAAQYQLGSYVGIGIDNPDKYIRFSVAPNDFQSMMIEGDKYEFVEPINNNKTIYSVHQKTLKNTFLCSTKENPQSVAQIKRISSIAERITANPLYAKSNNKIYHTLRLALSVTGEYTQYFGGVSGALAQMNATLTRVNGVFEKEFATHLNMINAPGLIFTDPATDPYSNASTGVGGAWNKELMNTLHSGSYGVTDADFDIGHLFGASGGGGDAGCIGCICSSDTTVDGYGNPLNYKGSGFTSPGIDKDVQLPPSGDAFDIDYVAHEIGHQLGGNHTFSYELEQTGVQVEPGSGSTIMGYAGITGSTTDVQQHSDPYFSYTNINQIQSNLAISTCDTESVINNNPPVITSLPSYTIPLGTAFVLTGNATDPEGDTMTYCWEEADDCGNTIITNSNIGKTTTGASFRSLSPVSTSVRYLPALETVLAGNLNSPSTWESVSSVARSSKFALTVRDNNVNGVQTQTAFQDITVGSAGPFTSNTTSVNAGTPTNVTWTVSGTTASPYSVANVKIDYSSDNGATWTVIAASTPNDGTESLTFPSSLAGKTIYIRLSAINNIFYAVSKALVSDALGTSEILKESGIKVFPNPVKDILNISKVSNKANYVIYSITGQLISNGKIVDNKVNVAHLPKGAYLINISEGDQNLKTKFIKE